MHISRCKQALVINKELIRKGVTSHVHGHSIGVIIASEYQEHFNAVQKQSCNVN